MRNELLAQSFDYLIFKKYDKDFFIVNLVFPIYEDEVSLRLYVCKKSNLLNIEDKFDKLLKFEEIDFFELEFLLNHIDIKIKLFELFKKLKENSLDNESLLEEFFNLLISFSIENRASDIHIESYKSYVIFRFRIDGKLLSFFSLEKEFIKILSSYIKLISNLDITQVRLPQDSRFSLELEDKKYDFRVSFIPTIEDESIVIRVLDDMNLQGSLDELEFSEHILKELKDVLFLTQGLVLVSGPTGSGKTTTLYSLLKHINSDEKKIITVEDPVEYKIDSLSQIQVNTKVGLSFETILKNILRQDPDIIFIGEIRDKLSLDIALQASLTGHLVIASIHSNNCIETISRLYDLNADPFLVSSTLKLIFAQRLVLTFCKYCNNEGCSKCNYTKYYGREPIAEVLRVDENLSSMIFKKVDTSEIKNYLNTKGFINLISDGLNKCNKNITSKEEVYKVALS